MYFSLPARKGWVCEGIAIGLHLPPTLCKQNASTVFVIAVIICSIFYILTRWLAPVKIFLKKTAKILHVSHGYVTQAKNWCSNMQNAVFVDWGTMFYSATLSYSGFLWSILCRIRDHKVSVWSSIGNVCCIHLGCDYVIPLICNTEHVSHVLRLTAGEINNFKARFYNGYVLQTGGLFFHVSQIESASTWRGVSSLAAINVNQFTKGKNIGCWKGKKQHKKAAALLWANATAWTVSKPP